MELRDYLHFSRKTITSFAKNISISRCHLTQIVNGHKRASIHLAKHIEEVTGGEVTVKDLRPDE